MAYNVAIILKKESLNTKGPEYITTSLQKPDFLLSEKMVIFHLLGKGGYFSDYYRAPYHFHENN